MGNFAKVEGGIVTMVIVADQTFIDTLPDKDLYLATSYTTEGNQNPQGVPFRGNYAGIGYTYNPEYDVFYAPQPYPSWILDHAIWQWVAPVPYPEGDGYYVWDEDTLSWVPWVNPNDA